MRRAILIFLLLVGPAAARALVPEGTPLPRPKPFSLRTMQGPVLPVPRPAPLNLLPATAGPFEQNPPADLVEEVSEPAKPSACQLRLGELAAATPLSPLVGPGACSAVDVVRLEAVLLADKTRIAVEPPATLRCEMAEAVAHWIRDDVVAVAANLESRLVGIENVDSYNCRGRNRIAGAKVSEHGKANALDVRALKLTGRRAADLTDPTASRAMRETLRASACARFTTVLGPGSDGFHENHIHVDLAERRGGYRVCQWEVRDPAPAMVQVPTPRPRPLAAPARAAQVEEFEED